MQLNYFTSAHINMSALSEKLKALGEAESTVQSSVSHTGIGCAEDGSEGKIRPSGILWLV